MQIGLFRLMMRRACEALGVALVVVGCASQEPPAGSGFGHWIQIAPERVGNILLARTPIEGALLDFIQKYLAETNRPIGNLKLVYLSANSVAELTRPITFQKGQQEISIDYYSRRTSSQTEVALFFFDEQAPAGTPVKGGSKLVVLRFDTRTGTWKEI